MSKNPETKIEDAYNDWLRDEFPLPALALKLVLFVGRGFPDRTVLCRGRVFFIEFKTKDKSSKVEFNQNKWHMLLKRLGFNVYICRSTRDAIKATKKEMDCA